MNLIFFYCTIFILSLADLFLHIKVENLKEEKKQLEAENKLLKDALAIERHKRYP